MKGRDFVPRIFTDAQREQLDALDVDPTPEEVRAGLLLAAGHALASDLPTAGLACLVAYRRLFPEDPV